MHRQRSHFIYALLVILAAAASAAAEQPSLDGVLDQLFAVQTFAQTAISPDGTRVAWVQHLLDKNNQPSGNSAIYVGAARRANAGRLKITACSMECDEHDIAWSPDSAHIAFLSDGGERGQLQLYLAPAIGGAPKKLTSLKGALSNPGWSPDGKTLTVLFTENAPRAGGPMEAVKPPTGVIESKIYEQRLTVVDPASGKVRQVSPPDMYVYEYDWSPDGSRLVVLAAPGEGDNNWYIARFYSVVPSTGEWKPLLDPKMQVASPRWSPDGKSIAFIGGLMSDEGITGGDIYLLPAEGGKPRNATPGMKYSASSFAWTRAGEIEFAGFTGGSNMVGTLEVASGSVQQVWTASESISDGAWGPSLSLARDGKTSAVIRQSFEHPPEVWAGPTGAWQQVTHSNDLARPQWGPAKSIEWTSDGLAIQGWLLYPRDFDPARKYPLVVEVHGGPASAAQPKWPAPFFNMTVLSSQGYFVLFPNPRGSYGRGEAFTRASVKDFGYGDFRDILRGVDEAVMTAPVDNERVGLTGWSYGGFMTMWGVTQTNRFRTAVAGAGLANWQSYYGENGIDQWMIPFFGASVYDDPAVYAKSSPITFIKNVKTPTLILVGQYDVECPTPQSYEFWHALKTLGVKTELVVYPDEGHGFTDMEHKRDVMRRALAWFNDYLKN